MKPNRRDFLTKSTVSALSLAGVPYFIPSSALGLDGKKPPSSRISIGCIGTGGRGRMNMRGLLEQGAHIAAVCDVDENSQREAIKTIQTYFDCPAAQRKYPGCNVYRDFRDLLHKEDIDAVMIATPDHWHTLPVVMAARMGKDIYCEKPLALTIEQGRTMVNEVERYGVVFQTGTQQRSEQQFRRACELVRNGRVGKIHTVEVETPGSMSCDGFYLEPVPSGFDYDMWLGPAPLEPFSPKRVHPFGWRWIFDYAGGCVTDWGAHHIDIVQWALGTTDTGPIEIQGKGVFPKDGLFNTALSWHWQALYKNGVKVIGFARDEFTGTFPDGITFRGDKGWLFIRRGRMDAHPKSILKEKIGTQEIRLCHSDNHYRNFLQSVESRQPTVAPIDQAHRSITVCHLANIALRLGRKIHWNPQQEKIIGDDTAARMLSRPMRSPWHL